MSDDAATRLLADSINSLRGDMREDRKAWQQEVIRLHQRSDVIAKDLQEAVQAINTRVSDKADAHTVAALELICTGKSCNTDKHGKAGWLARLGMALLANPMALAFLLVVGLVIVQSIIMYSVVTGRPATDLNPVRQPSEEPTP